MHGTLYMYAICAFCSCAQGPIAMGPNQKGEGEGGEERRVGERGQRDSSSISV